MCRRCRRAHGGIARSRRRLLRSGLLAVVALGIACNDAGVAAETLGSMALAVVEPPPPAPPAPPIAASRHAADTASAGRPLRSPGETEALDAVQAIVTGPTSRTVDLTFNTSNDRWEGRIDSLVPGSYSVVLRGLVSGDVDSYGTTTGVTVTAGNATTPSLTFESFRPTVATIASPTTLLRFPVTFSSISTATGYAVQFADNSAFSAADSIAATATNVEVGQVPGAGTYYVRVRADNANVSNGRWSDPRSVEVTADTVATSASGAPSLGFGGGINGRRPTANILPAGDVDWYRLRACSGDTLTAETFAKRLTPPSDLNTVVTLRSGDSTTLIDQNDDAVGTDSRIVTRLPLDGDYVVSVAGTGGTIGAYQLDLTVALGSANNGTDCSPPPPLGTAVAVGFNHSCTLGASGSTYCWGVNTAGQLGDLAAEYYSSSPVTVARGITFAALTAGENHTCALTGGGTAYCWGMAGFTGGGGAPPAALTPLQLKSRDSPPQQPGAAERPVPVFFSAALAAPPLGTPAQEQDIWPTQVVGQHTFSQLDAGAYHTCGITTGSEVGQIWCWGYSFYGALGNGTSGFGLDAYWPTPVRAQSPVGVTFTQVTAGDYHTCALTSTGDVYCWGLNSYGEVGDGTTNDADTPQLVNTTYGPFVGLAAGRYHTCALDGSGDVWCWGDNHLGQFGNGASNSSLSPTAGASGYGFTRIRSGVRSSATCGITAANVAYCWGNNSYGALGDGNVRTYSETPVMVAGGIAFAALDISGQHTCGTSVDGRVYCWGTEDFGELGDGTVVPITPQAVVNSSGFTNPTVGSLHSCAISSGTAYCWGAGGSGQLGAGNYASSASPVAVVGVTTFASISAGSDFTCGVTTGNAGYCWGNGFSGQLGNGVVSSPSPTAVPGTYLQIDAGLTSSACGINGSNLAYCWGANDYGQLGTGTSGDTALTPVAVNTAQTFEQISVGAYHACALTSVAGGDVWCWGRNNEGQLGNGTQTDALTPVQVDNLGGTLAFTSVRAGRVHTCATTDGGDSYCWGSGSFGELGDGTASRQLVPTLVSGGLGFDDVEAGQHATCGVAAGRGYCWGYNNYGQLGSNDLFRHPTPYDVVNLTGILTFDQIVTSGSGVHSCGTTATTMYCWGYNRDGQLGTGSLPQILTPQEVVGGIVARTPPAAPSPVSAMPVPPTKP